MKGARTSNAPAVYMLVRQDNKLLFVLRTHTGFMDGKYSLPAGRVEPGERFLAGAIREATEEVGVTVRPQDARHVLTQHRFGTPELIWVDVFFEAQQWEGKPYNALPEEHGEIAWFPVDALPADKIMDYQLAGLQAIARGKTYNEFGWHLQEES